MKGNNFIARHEVEFAPVKRRSHLHATLTVILDAVTLFWLPKVKCRTTRQHVPSWHCTGGKLSEAARRWLFRPCQNEDWKQPDWIANAAIYSSGLITGGTKQSANSASTSNWESEAVLLFGYSFLDLASQSAVRVILNSSHSEQTRRENQ